MILETEKILSNNDPILAKVILQIPKPEIESTNDVFHDLVSCIFEQQIHYRSTKRIFAKALEKSSIEHLTLDNFYLVEEHYLKNSNLATSKYETLLAFIDYWSNNTKDFNTLSDNEVVKGLSSIKGIGKWTIDMILLYTLQRQNVFPHDDYHLKQIMVSLYGLNEKVKLKAQMLEIAEYWGEHKSLAVLYLLAFKKFGTRL